MGLSSRRKHRPWPDEEGGELNIVPYLDVLMNLIIFMLLSTAGLVTYGVVNVTAPDYAPPTTAADSAGKKPQLLLSVRITRKGFFVTADDATAPVPAAPPTPAPPSGPTFPLLASGKYDFASLTARMEELKQAHPKATKVVIAAEADIPYQVLVQTMDAVRESPSARKILFPDVALAAL